MVTPVLDGPSLYHLELSVPLDKVEGDALMSDWADSPILDAVVGPVRLPHN